MATLTAPSAERPGRAWRLALITLLATVAGDATGAIITGTSAPYPFNGAGVGVTGFVLLAVALAGQLSAFYAVRTGNHRPLRICLTVLVAWYATCTAALITTPVIHQQTADGPSIALTALLAVAACWLARTTAAQLGGES